MRIISKFKDYYDGFMNHDKKDYNNKLWVRFEKEVKINMNDLKVFEDRRLWLNHNHHYHCFLVIAGKVYPFIEVYHPGGLDENLRYHESRRNFYYDIESYVNDHNIRETSYNKYYKYLFHKDDLIKFFKEPYPDMTDLCLQVGSPIILIQPEDHTYKDKDSSLRTCVINIRLADLSFSKVMESHSIFQEIDMFVSNIMVDDKMPISPMTDLEKVESHGFDKKISFRKQKQDDKKTI